MPTFAASVFFFVLLISFCFASNPNLKSGTYVQCDYEDGDQSNLSIDSNFDFTLLYLGGGCTGDVQFEVLATGSISFSTNNANVYNADFKYDKATATARTTLGSGFLEVTCGGKFNVGTSEDVLDCLFCGGKTFDIFQENGSDQFFLGNTEASCSSGSRPEELSIYPFTLSDFYYDNSAGLMIPSCFLLLCVLCLSFL